MTANYILVTGANGFIGSKLCRILERNKYVVSRVSRSTIPNNENIIENNNFFRRDINQNTVWTKLLKDVDSIIHLAGRAHIIKETEKDPLTAFRAVNTLGTECLARAAAEEGVKRFLYISSIGVNGNMNSTPYTELDRPSPHNDYAFSKWEAEQVLHSIAKETGMEVVIIRPPLVYGPGVKANFLNMMRWLHRGVPLPLVAIDNKRSLVALDNLVDLIMTCIDHPAATNQTFLAGDGEDLSTTELLRRMGKALGKPARLLPVPEWLLKIGLNAIGKSDIAQRLCSSLQVDISKAQNMLGWKPPLSVDEALKKTAEWYLKEVDSL